MKLIAASRIMLLSLLLLLFAVFGAQFAPLMGTGASGKHIESSSEDTSWPMFGHDLKHTRHSPSKAPKAPLVLWICETDASSSSPAVVDGMVFVGSNDYRLYALNETTGKQIWNYAAGQPVLSSPAVADGMVLVASLDSKVYALNETSGQKIWEYKTGSHIFSSPAVADGMMFFASLDGRVYCFGIIPGDVDCDGDVDVSDLFYFSKAYGRKLGDDNWNPNCDFNNDEKIDDSDLSDLDKNYGKTV